MVQFYNFFYGDRNKIPCEFDKMLSDTKKLNQEYPGKKPTGLDFLILNLFSCFGLLTMQVDSSGKPGADVLSFDSKTLDVFIVGCTTGIIKDDLKTIDALLHEMENELPEVFKKCNVTPLIISTGTQKFVHSDLKDAKDVGALLLGLENLKKIVEMLCTGRKIKDLVDYFDVLRTEQNESVETSLNPEY